MYQEFYVYILECNDKSYYIGVTNNYEKRVAGHLEGIDQRCYTFKRRPLKIVRLETFQSIVDAIAREKQLKRWSHRKKEALIQENFDLLQVHAKNNQSSHGSTGSP